MPYIIIDRDGVINYDSDEYIKNPDEWRPIPGSLVAIAQLNRAGFEVFVATNQSGVGRGYYDLEMLGLIHEKLMHELAAVGGYVQEIFFCPHHPDEHCRCRKPQPGMLYQIQRKYGLDLTQMYFIGDSWIDVQAAQEAGCKPILVRTGRYHEMIKHHPQVMDVLTFTDLVEAVDYVVLQEQNKIEDCNV